MQESDFTILLVDDEPDVLEFLSYNLTREGYKVHKAKNGKDGIEAFRKFHPQLVILDVMMPGMDGIDTCREIRNLPTGKDVIIIFLTARGEDFSQLAGFDAGADDYITKPIKPKILSSRINAILRRLNHTGSTSHSTTNELRIDKEKYTVLRQGEQISLPRKEFELLALLVSKPNKVFTREEIYAKVWGNEVIVGERTIDVHVRRIREKIGLENIKTIKGVGYKYEVLV
ncbi:MAG TPA: response regulator transcription factor [Lentimicrobium sp.]|nr:response regulator transcription factor [Lentimicrobium sp.]